MQHKYQLVADTLRTAIQRGDYEQTMLLPTEQALCQKFQVSRQTVRQALSLLASEGLIERRQGSGSHILDQAPPKRLTIAVITTYISNYIFPSILREMETVLAANNAAPTLFSTHNQVSNERRVLQSLLDHVHPDGILVEGSKTSLPNPNLDLYRALMDRGIPLVFMHGSYRRLPGSLSVLDDNYGGSRQLVEYLYRKGHRSIAGIFKSDDVQGLQRYEGYVDTLRNLRLPLEDAQVFWYNTENKNHILQMDGGWPAVERTLSGCTAVVCYNDEIASRLIINLHKQGVRIPQDMAVVSFDNSQYCEICPVGITSLSHSHDNVGKMAAELLIRRLRGEECTSETAFWTLVERESS